MDRHIQGMTATRFLTVIGLASLAFARVAGAADPAPAGVSVLLGRPTDHAVTLSLLAADPVEVRVVYGLHSETSATTSGGRALTAKGPSEVQLDGLTADARYDYQFIAADTRVLAAGSFHTQRAAGRSFTFALQGDSHPERAGKMFDASLYALTLRNAAAAQPDFYITLGDDFSIERLIERQELSQAAVDQVYAGQRAFLDRVGRSAPLFLVNGNHEQAALCNHDGTPDNPAVYAGRARTRFYPLPAPDGFYTGNSEPVAHVGLPRDYYAWTWGDALFVMLDPYWHSAVAVDNEAGARGGGRTAKRRDLWGITLGDAQYRWLARTLLDSRARWKFVFCHHVLGTGRGGIECATLGEWGGKSRDGTDEFAARRPGWEMPIHALMARAGVTIFFQGHDHLFARQELDGVVYQSCPNPADPTATAFNREAYRSGDIRPNSGHVRVTVSPASVSVDYIRSWLPADEAEGRKNGETAFHYDIPAPERHP